MLSASNNHVAAGIGQCLQAWMLTTTRPGTAPIILSFGNRTMALGRRRMAGMTGRNAFIYVKSKLGLLNATTPLHLQALFHGPAEEEERYMEIDLEAWEELVPHILKLRIMT
ncbi:hypothetical protein CPB85DRAFT_1223021 [Mucidula mucida]|nr:hypothetical protein CPB85DRAFT_1223021 [Mucidula mucida]